MRRGIIGGTFDPPHLAHLVIAEAAYRTLDLDVITFLPAGTPWQKTGRQVTDAVHRWEMTKAAVSGIPYFGADDREVSRPGLTFTIDTLQEMEGEGVTLILGADTAVGLPTWHRAEEVMERVQIGVAPRPGVAKEQVEEVLGEQMVWLPAPLLDISGTGLRQRAREGQSLRFMVREAVWEYLIKHRVYG